MIIFSRNIILILLLLIFIAPVSAISKKAETIDELIAMYDITLCATCHEDKYAEWKTSTMGNAVVDPRVLRGMNTFIKLELDQEATLSRKDLTICLNCHVPQIKDASENLVIKIADLVTTSVEHNDISQREAAKKELSKLNINCLVCHNMKAIGFNKQPRPKTIYGPDDINTDAHKAAGYETIRSEYMDTSQFCAQCHHCPPDVPWESCPTLYTTYIEDFIGKGRKETCQECHMKGKERLHKFLGPENLDFLKSAVTLTLSARATKYIDTYEAKKIPALAVTVNLTNNAGHTIPHGCAFTPQAVLNVIVKNQAGDVIFSDKKVFHVGDLYFKGGKKVAMAEWDVTATEHFDLGLKALATDTHTYVVPLNADVTSATVETEFIYLYTRDRTFPVQKVVKKVVIE